MFIKIKHSKLSKVELRDNSLLIHSMQGKARVLQDDVTEIATVVIGDLVHIIAFSDQSFAWHFRGSDDLDSQRIEFDQPYFKLGQLVGDDQGNLHLFYFAKQKLGYGLQLKHRIFSDSWSTPQTVSINVYGAQNSLSASWHDDGYLHVVYLSQNDQQLYYRVFVSQERVWSGAITLATEKCSNPQLLSVSKRLYLFWLEEQEQTCLQVRCKNGNWSSTTQISSGQSHVSNVGYLRKGDQWQIYWGEKDKLYYAFFDHWADLKLAVREDFNYIWQVENLNTFAAYEPKVVKKKDEKVLEARPALQDERVKKQESEEQKLQKIFIEQAFRTLQEWEKAQNQVKQWKKDLKPPEPVDLNPLVNRVERLERRLLSIQQGEERTRKNWEEKFGLMNRRLRDLENFKIEQPVSFWQRLFKKI